MKQHKAFRMELRRQRGNPICGSFPVNEGDCLRDGASVRLEEHTEQGLQTAALHLNLKDEDAWVNHGLEKEQPIRVFVPLEPKPKKMTALYLFSPWWTRPAFVDRFEEIPPLTQVLFLQYEEHCACFVPMVGREWKACVHGGTETELCLELTAGMGGAQQGDEPLYLLTEGTTLSEAVHRAFSRLAEEKGIRTRERRRLPEMFRFLGWCSWDAFYTEVDETGIRQKAEELAEKSIPVKWMLIDDGWMSTQGRYLTDYAPDGKKFPQGFRGMIEDLRRTTSVRWFGVWHALGGYWNGVKPGSPLARQQADHLCRTVSGALVPSPNRGAGFYRDWYKVLAREGIEFVKVDGQSTASAYYENTVPISAAVRGMNQSLESGAVLMDNAIINCMGMAMENVLARPVSALSRNSDDFFPRREGSFAEHLLENAYNALYHDELYCCDWDMFWTSHPDSRKHSLLRAISGGPIYFSDRVGETDPAVLKPLTYLNGEIPMMNRSAKPTEDCIFSDPLKEGVLKLHNAAPWGEDGTAGGIAVYNLTGKPQPFSFAPRDIPELDQAERYWVFDYFGKTACSLGREELYQGALDPDGYGWYVILPETGSVACLGLVDKYVGFPAVEQVQQRGRKATVVLRESGPFAWMSSQPCSRVEWNGTDVTDRLRQKGSLYFLPAEEKAGKVVLTIAW